MKLIFSPAHFEAMLAQVLSDPTREQCGLLAGQGGRVDRVLPVPNDLRSSTAYRMAGPEFVEAMCVCEFRPLGIFHSHVADPPLPSPTDVAAAAYPESVYVIVSLQASPPSVRAFKLVSGLVTEVEVCIEQYPA